MKTNDVYSYIVRQTQDITTMGVANAKQNLSIDLKYQMIDEDDSSKKLKVTFEHISLKSTSLAGEMDYDSDQPSNNSLLKSLGEIINKEYFVYFNNNGLLTQVIGPERTKKNNISPNDIARLFNDSTFATMLENTFDIYPGKPIRVNEKWNTKSSATVSNFEIQKDNTYILKSVELGVATISASSLLNMPSSTIYQGKYKLQIEMKGTQVGIIKMDIESGVIISVNSTQKIDGKINSMGQDLPMTISSEFNSSSKKIQ